MTDIVKTQLLLAQGASLDGCGLPSQSRGPEFPPLVHSIQLRITAEDVQNNWTLSIGKITSFQLPTGNGIRVDTHLITGHPTVVSADFDSLLAKLVITASSWEDVVRKARRALDDTQISGVKTNIDILRGIAAHPEFLEGRCDTQWLENEQQKLLKQGQVVSAARSSHFSQETNASTFGPSLATSNTLFRKGDAWSITLAPPNDAKKDSKQALPPHHLELTRVLRNDFPTSLSAEILFTSPPTSTTPPKTTPYILTLENTTSSASVTTSHHRRANASDPSHISIPFPGKLVEVLVDEDDMIKEGDVICIVQQMKMELEVRAPRSGRIVWVLEVDEGEDVGEGMLAAIVEREGNVRL